MFFQSFSRFFGRPWSKKERRSSPKIKARSRVRLTLENLEERLSPAVLPPAIVHSQQSVDNGYNPVVVADPVDPNKLVMVYSDTSQVANCNTLVYSMYSTNGGANWVPFGNATSISNTGQTFSYMEPRVDFDQYPWGPVKWFSDHTDATAAFGRDEFVYISYSAHTADYLSGELVVAKFDFRGGKPEVVDLDAGTSFPNYLYNGKQIYHWNHQDPAFNPVIALDNNSPEYTDPETGAKQIDPMVNQGLDIPDHGSSKAIYVAWNTNATGYTGVRGGVYSTTGINTFNPNEILVVASGDGAQNFTSPQIVTDNAYWGTGGTSPQIAFTQPSADGQVKGGQLIFFYNNGNQIWTSISDPTRNPIDPNNLLTPAAAEDHTQSLTPFTGAIPQGASRTFTQNLTLTNTGMSLQDLDVTVNLIHPDMSQVSITLIGPNGQSVPLLLNQVGSDGKVINTSWQRGLVKNPAGIIGLGIEGAYNANGGVDWSNTIGTVFDDSAPRRINDPANIAPYAVHLRPEVGSLLAAFGGLDSTQLNGNWQLVINDVVADAGAQPQQYLSSWGLKFTFGIDTTGLGPDKKLDNSVATVANLPNGNDTPNTPYPFNTANGLATGIGPWYSVAVDTTQGSFSQFQSRIYVAFTSSNNGADIYLTHSDDNGTTWSKAVRVNDDTASDGFSEGNRAQFMPAVAVDQSTGTVVVTWYDARWDAAHGRVATYIATSIDGGNTFSQGTWLNQTKTATDAITGQTVDIEPVPTNMNLSAIGTINPRQFGFGDHQSLIVHNGDVLAVWTGNANSPSSQIWTAQANIGRGPRVISTDMGLILNDRSVYDESPLGSGSGYIVYDNTFSANGTRQLDGFVVQFDRPIDPTTFTTADIVVKYGNTQTQVSPSAGTLVAVGSINPLDDVFGFGPRNVGANAATSPFGGLASRFFVKFQTPQSGVGTYSWAIGSDISDRIRYQEQIVNPAGPAQTTDVDPADMPVHIGQNEDNTNSNPVLSKITIPALPAGQVTYKMTVSVNIQHPLTSDLRLVLLAPDGTPLILASGVSSTFPDYTNVTFDDAALQLIGANPYAPIQGSVQPQQPLSQFSGGNPQGDWTLVITDLNPNNDYDGNLLDWSITITPGTPEIINRLGSQMDQNANGTPGENNVDVYANPSSQNNIPFVAPYTSTSLPVIIPGPHVISTSVPNQPASPDNLVLNSTTNAIDVTFDRDIDPSTFTAADIISFTGPYGPVFTVPNTPGATLADFFRVQALTSRTFRIYFVSQKAIGAQPEKLLSISLSGSYALQFGSDIQDTAGNSLDNNLNAGLDVLRGANPLRNKFDITAHASDASNSNLAIGPHATVTSTIHFAEGFTIDSEGATDLDGDTVLERLGLTLNIQNMTGGNVQDYQAYLVSPDNTVVRLFINLPKTGTNFTSTSFDDFAASSIRDNSSAPPYQGTFKPEQPLSILNGLGSQGDWKLVVVNTGSGSATLSNWNLTLPHSIPGTGLGEVADRYTVSFRVFNQDMSTDVPKDNWTAVGPMPMTIMSATYDTKTYISTGTNSNINIAAAQTVRSFITVPDNFTIALEGATDQDRDSILENIQLSLNIQNIQSRDVQARLVSPTGQVVVLFTNLNQAGTGFTNTTFNDYTAASIQDPTSTPPYSGTYKPVTPLSALDGTGFLGKWALEIVNTGATTGKLTSWSLKLPYNTTSIGPNVNSDYNQLAGRVTAMAVDPTDTSGNTVFIGGPTGGLWKTTNFLTTDPKGPTWIPLLDFGPVGTLYTGQATSNSAMRIQSIAIFPGSTGPEQSEIFVGTGSLNDSTPGVGLLHSKDGGKTWEILDSLSNYSGGNVLPINSASRDHNFSGTVVNKIAIDPKPLNGNLVVYMAVTDLTAAGRGGIYRSKDNGRTWNLLNLRDANNNPVTGNATDVTLAPGSADANGNLAQLYVAISGRGVFSTTNALNATFLNEMAGGQGPAIMRVDGNNASRQIPVNAPPATPSNATGRIVIATPALTGDPLRDSLYKNWLYALVTGTTNLLYVTKDNGRTWTQVQLPQLNGVGNTALAGTYYSTNDESKPETDVVVARNNAMTIAVDPTNAQVVYIGGATPFNNYTGRSGLIRVDITKLEDPYAFVGYNNSDPGTASYMTSSTGSATVFGTYGLRDLVHVDPNNPTKYALRQDYYNLLVDPNNPFIAPSTFQFEGTLNFNNRGEDAQWWEVQNIFPVPATTRIQNDLTLPPQYSDQNMFEQQQLLTMVDPVTGKTRLLIANNFGVFSMLDAGNGSAAGSIGGYQNINGSRNGNLQIAELDRSAAQPTTLAANYAESMFYAAGNALFGNPYSAPDILQTGNLNWTVDSGTLSINSVGIPNFTGATSDVHVLQDGSGTILRFVTPFAVDTPLTYSDFLQMLKPDGNPSDGVANYVPTSITSGLFDSGVDNPASGIGRWLTNLGSHFAINPYDSNGVLVGATSALSGKPVLFLMTNLQGPGVPTFQAIALPSDLGIAAGAANSLPALAFGAPQTGHGKSDFVYAGTSNGKIYVNSNGVGGAWTDLTGANRGDLTGNTRPIVSIITSPMPDSHAAFAITDQKVYYIQDSLAAAGTTAGQWVDITGNLFSLAKPIFGSASETYSPLTMLTALQVDWRYSVPDPASPTGFKPPRIYVAGDGGVYRLKDTQPVTGGTFNWNWFPATADGSLVDGGYLPNAKITDLTLSIGQNLPNVPNTGSSPNVLLATTAGRGVYAIRLDIGDLPPSSQTSGPKVIGYQDPNPSGGPSDRIRITFDSAVDASSFTTDDVTLFTPGGQPIPITSITDVTPAPSPGQQVQPSVFEIQFQPQTVQGAYRLTVGPNITDPAGNKMNQNGNTVNGEASDYFTTLITLNDQKPAISDITDKLTNVNTPITVNFTVTGNLQTPANNLIITAASGDQTLVQNSKLVLGGSGSNRTLTITPENNAKGVVTITVTVQDTLGRSSSDTFNLRIDSVPVFTGAPYANIGPVSHLQFPRTVPVAATDGDNDPLTITADAYDPLNQLQQSLGLVQLGGSFYTNTLGQNEKYLWSTVKQNWYVLLPDTSSKTPTAGLYRWDNQSVISSNTLTAVVDQSVWTNPFLLINSLQQSPQVKDLSAFGGSITLSNGQLTIDPGTFIGSFTVTLSAADPYTTTKTSFLVTVTNSKPALTVPATLTASHSLFAPSMTVQVSVNDADQNLSGQQTDPVNLTATAYDPLYYLSQRSGLIALNGSFYTNARGQNEKYLYGAKDGNFYILLYDAGLNATQMYRWDNNSVTTTVANGFVATLAAGVYQNPYLLVNATSPAPLNGVVVGLNSTSGVGQFTDTLSITPNSYLGTFAVQVQADDGRSTDTKTMLVTVTNAKPLLDALSDQPPVSHTEAAKFVHVKATDADKDPTNQPADSVVITAAAYDPKYYLRDRYGLTALNGSFYTNARGQGEKYLYGTKDGNWYILLNNPGTNSANLYRWDNNSIASSMANGFVATLDAGVYQDPGLLVGALTPTKLNDLTTQPTTIQGSGTADGDVVIQPNSYSGTIAVVVTASSYQAQDTKMFLFTSTNNAPSLTLPGNIPPTSHAQIPQTQTFTVSDADGDPVTVASSDVKAVSPEFYLKQQLGLTAYGGTIPYNLRHQLEWYLWSTVEQNWFILLPDISTNTASLYRWQNQDTISSNQLVAVLDMSVWQNPYKLINATAADVKDVDLTSFGGGVALNSFNGASGSLNVNPGTYLKTFAVQVTAKDSAGGGRTDAFLVTSTDDLRFAAVSNQTFDSSTNTLPLQVQLNISDSDPGDTLTQTNVTFKPSSRTYQLDQQYGFYDESGNGSYFYNHYGYGEKWLGAANSPYTSPSPWYAILPSGALYQFSNNEKQPLGQYITTLDSSVYQDPSLLWNAQPGTLPSNLTGSVDTNTHVLTLNWDSGYKGIFQVTVQVSDGYRSISQSFYVTVK